MVSTLSIPCPQLWGLGYDVYRTHALKSHYKLKNAIRLKATLGNFLLHQNSSSFTVTFGEKVLTLAHSIATVNLNKSEDLVTNTTAASKYIPMRPGICIN